MLAIRTKRRRLSVIFVAIAVCSIVLLPYAWGVVELLWRATDSVGQPKCYNAARMVNTSATCNRCVNFLTIANKDTRWDTIQPILSALRIVSTNLRASQTCFVLHVYTNIAAGTVDWQRLVAAGGAQVRLYAFPNDLPPNAYTGKNRWLELSRHKLDVVERHMNTHGHKVIWTDLDTVVLTDLSCAYAQLENFIISRVWFGLHVLRGRGGMPVNLRHGYSVYGDLWMADSKLIAQVRRLEAEGMPPPALDLQDYYAVLLNECTGVITDLRGFLHDNNAQPMCFGFDYSSGYHPDPQNVFPMKIVNNSLYCSVQRDGKLVYYRAAYFSFIFPSLLRYLQNPRELFRTQELAAWARTRGFDFRD